MAENISVWRSEWGNIRALESQLDEQRGEAQANQRRLASQLHELQGDLSDRVDRLTASFDAFVELSEIRDHLGLFVDARRWRVAARQLVESSLSRAPAPADEGVDGLDDVAGYWLPAALRALPDLLERGSSEEDLGEALRRDRGRTSMFVLCVGALLGSPSIADEHVVAVFDGDGANVDVAQVAIWRAASAGLLSASAVAVIQQAFARRIAAFDANTHDAVVASLVRRPPGAAGTASATGPVAVTSSAGAATDQAAAAADLQSWSEWLTHGEPPEGSVPASTDEVIEGIGERLLAVVRSLVEEGSAPEREMLDRADALRAVIDPSQPPLPAGWDDDAGALGTLLADDVLAGEARADGVPSDPSTSRDSARLLSGCIAEATDALLVRASAAAPTTTLVKHAGRSVTVTPSGVDAGQLAAIDAGMGAPRPDSTVDPRRVAVGGALAVVVFVVLGVAVAPGWFVLAAIAGGAAAVWGLALQRSSVAAEGDQRAAGEELRSRIGHATQQLIDGAGRIQVAQAEAANAHATIRSALGR